MKDSEYYGFSTDDNCDDFKVVDLNDVDDEDDFRIIDLVNFDTEEDVRIVALADCERWQGKEQREGGMEYPSISALKPRSTRRRHIVQSMVVVGLVCAFLLVMLGSSTLVRTALASRFTTATPRHASAQGAEPMALVIDSDRFYIAPNVPGEPVLIDGHVLAHVPLIGVDPPLHLSYGQHTLLWRTSGKQVMACTVSVPPSFSDTCAYDGPQPLPTGLAVWIISVPHSEFELP